MPGQSIRELHVWPFKDRYLNAYHSGLCWVRPAVQLLCPLWLSGEKANFFWRTKALEWASSSLGSQRALNMASFKERISPSTPFSRDPGYFRQVMRQRIMLYPLCIQILLGKRKLILNQINTTWNTCFVQLVSIFKKFYEFLFTTHFNWEASQKVSGY